MGSFEREETGGGRLHFSVSPVLRFLPNRLLNHLSNQL